MKHNTPVLNFFKAVCISVFSMILPSTAQTPHIDSLLRVVKTQKEDTLKILTYREICKAYMVELNDMDKVMEYATRTLELSQPIHFKKGLAFGMFYKGVATWSKGNYELALDNYKKALVLMKELNIIKGENACYINIGLIYTDRGNYPEALHYLKKGIKLNEVANDKQGMQIGYDNIGNIYLLLGDYTQALNYYLKSLKIAEERKEQLVISYANNNIGDVFYAQNRLDVALLYYKKSVKYLEEIKELAGMGSGYSDIGNVYFRKKEFDKALIYHLKDFHLKESLNDKQGTAIACNKAGFDYFAQNKLQQALSYQLKSYHICKEIGYKKGLIDACGGIGNVYEQQELSKALVYYDEMLATAKELDYKEGIRDAYANHASVYTKLRNFEKALSYTQLFHESKDSLLNKENFKQVNELNTRYETDKKENEILLLTKDQELNAKIIKQQQLVRWGLIGGLGLLSISVFSIYRRYHFKQKANVILEKQKQEIQQKNMLITDSIDYAQTIQEAVLPTQEEIEQFIPNSFILYKPKATVSGDFYWINQVKDTLLCAVADCTGHGVPGAFMSLLGYNMLENAVKDLKNTTPATILNALNREVTTRLAGNNIGEESKHGMDISLITINKKTNFLEFAGAHNSIYIVRKNELIELKADKMGIGGNKHTNRTFTNQITEIQTGDMIYLFTDGFPDQIGGPNRKKFYYPPFKELLVSISSMDAEQQQNHLNNVHAAWMGEKMDQTDDILIMGIRYS
jgi:serine phosphatase RsbU (regulator of sigma subunit)